MFCSTHEWCPALYDDPLYLWIGLMTDDYKIYVDASRPATLNNGAREP